MPTVEVFAPTWCPAAYVEHDDEPEACRFAADVEWLAAHGVPVVRATLSDQPGRFVEHDAVRFLMNVFGPAVLPVVLVDGFMRSHGTYPTRDQLAAWADVEPALAEERAHAALVHESAHHEAPEHSAAASDEGHTEEDTLVRDAVAALERFVIGGSAADASVPEPAPTHLPVAQVLAAATAADSAASTAVAADSTALPDDSTAVALQRAG